MYSKLLINGELEVVTGMHIGTGGEFAAIGAVDSPIVRDPLTNLPIIPGSSMKGKMRTLLAKQMNTAVTKSVDDDCVEIKRLFGSSSTSKSKPSRVIFSDALLSNVDELHSKNVDKITEVKFENSINRFSGVSNPRQIERAIRGSKFNFSLVYNIEDAWKDDVVEDLKNLCEGLKLLKYDYLGGHGTRGYGRVDFNNLTAEVVIGEVDGSIVSEINKILKEV